MFDAFLYIVLIYALSINIIGFIIMGVDKNKAKKRLWRIAEKRLFLVAIIGGAIGVFVGMLFFRHKTKHWYFMIGIPFILLVEITITLFFLKNYIMNFH